MKVRIQIIKVYDVEVDTHDPAEAIERAYEMQTTEIERDGRLVDATTDHAEVDAEGEGDGMLDG